MMKSKIICRLIDFIVLAAVLAFSMAANAAEFSADMVNSQIGGDMKGKIYIKGDKMRVEGKSPEGKPSISIIDIKKGAAYTLMPEEKMYIDMSDMGINMKMDQFKNDEEIAKIADKSYVGTEDANGYLCDKYEFIYHDKSHGTMTQWYSKKLDYPVKMIYHSPSGEMVIEYKNIREGGISDSLFEIPAGYQKMAIPGLRR